MNANLGANNKLRILPATDGSPMTADSTSTDAFEVMINPAGYTRKLKIDYNEQQTLGQPSGNVRFAAVCPEELELPELVLDGTGVVEMYAGQSVTTMIQKMLKLLYVYDGQEHEPKLVCLQWGDMNFYGRARSLDINYTLFKPTGEPLRAKVKLSLVSAMNAQEGLLRANLSSPDLSHLVEVRAGDTLPLLCNRIYRNPAYYAEIARINGLVGFRNLQPGTVLRFPPLR